MYIIGSIKSSINNEDVSFISASIDCSDGTSVVLGSNEVSECRYNGDGYFSIEQRIDILTIDDEEVEEIDEDELFDTLVNSSVFNIQLDCDNPSILSLRSLVVKFDNGMICNLSVDETTVNSEM